MKLCECNCGKEVKNGKKFLHGHNIKFRLLGKKLTKEHKKKLSESLKGRKFSDEHKERISKSNKGKNHGVKGKLFTEEHKKKISNGLKGKLKNKGKNNPMYGKTGINSPIYGRRHSVDSKKKMSEYQLKIWSDKSFRDKQIKAMMSGNRIKPNKQELLLLNILNKLYPNEWKFVGNGEIIINGKNPDFININGKKLLIELFGNYWHRNSNPEDRIKCFAPYGYKTLIVWERELENANNLTKKLGEFLK